MSSVYNEYNNTWESIHNYIKMLDNIDIIDVTFNRECGPIYNIIDEGKYININNIYEKKNFYFFKSREKIIELILKNNFDVIIELGSGWGRNIFHYLKSYPNIFNDLNIISGEYTKGGCDTQEYIKKTFFPDAKLQIFEFDYYNSDIFLNYIKKHNFKNCLILTFWSIEQITYLDEKFFENLFNISDKLTCINIEPVGWQIDEKSLMKENITGYRNYYNKNLFPLLKKYEKENKLKINDIILDFNNFGPAESCGTLIEWEKI